jgi:hypothetical protein
MSSERRIWAVVMVLAAALVLHLVVSIRTHARTARKLRANRAILLQLEAEATARRGGRPRSPASAPAEGGR